MYLILGIFWFAVYNLVNVLNADSFLEVGWAILRLPAFCGLVPLLQHGYLDDPWVATSFRCLTRHACLRLWNRRQAFSHNSYWNKTLARLPALFEIDVLSVDTAERSQSIPGRGEINSHHGEFFLRFLIKKRFHP